MMSSLSATTCPSTLAFIFTSLRHDLENLSTEDYRRQGANRACESDETCGKGATGTSKCSSAATPAAKGLRGAQGGSVCRMFHLGPAAGSIVTSCCRRP